MKLGRAIVGAAVFLLAACNQHLETKSASTLPIGDHYVAMGSSFAAGPGLGKPQPGTPGRCMRTMANYATRLAERFRLTLTDASCSGAATEHILHAWRELPPQIDAVTADTRLVTVTIGGNDLNYVGGLFGASCRAGISFGTSKKPATCPPRKLPTEADYTRLENNMREIARQVKARAPKARLVFVEYVSLVPDTPCNMARLLPDDAAAARVIGTRLAAITEKAARDSGAMLLPVSVQSRNHTPCDAQPWATGFPLGYDGSQGAPWHPNAAGMAAIADSLAKMLTQH